MPSANRSVRGEQPEANDPPLTAEIKESLLKRERTQKVFGQQSVTSKNYFRLGSKGKAKGVSFEKRAERYAALTESQKLAGFRKTYISNVERRPSSDNVPALSFYDTPATKKHGFPLQSFPLFKMISTNRPLNPNVVEYSVDELDLDFLVASNAERMKTDRHVISPAQFEHWIDRLEKMCQFTPRKFKRMIGPNGEELDDVCNVCLDGESANCNQIVFCDLCNLAVHQDCYGIPFLPESALACRRCAVMPGKQPTCLLCPSKVGAFKQYKNSGWVHVLCVLWVDETIFGNNIFMEDVKNIERALHIRKGLSCSLCKNKKEAKQGACIQCCETKCTVSFHVTCARSAGLTMRICETEEGVNRFVWCMKHTPPETEADKEQKQMMMRNARRENEKHDSKISVPDINVSNISAILAQCHIDDPDEIIVYWFFKRMDQYGAPLMRFKSQLVDVKRRRKRERVPITSEMERTLRVYDRSFADYGNILDMMLRREKLKKQYFQSHLRLFEMGYKPTEVLCVQTIELMKKKDETEVFAKPVDVEGYRKEIKHPMCLKTMTEKAQKGGYPTVQSLQDDVDLMLKNCAQFNRGNKFFIEYGKRFGRQVKPLLDAARKEEQERKAIPSDANFSSHLISSLMNQYVGWSDKPKTLILDEAFVSKVEDITEIIEVPPEPSAAPTSGRRKGRRAAIQPPPTLVVKVEEVDEDPQPPPPGPGTTPRRPRSRRRGGVREDEDPKPSTSASESTTTTRSSTSGSRKAAAAAEDNSSRLCDPESTDVLRKRINSFGEVKSPLLKKTKKAEIPVTKSPSTLKQTSLTSFFSTTPKAQQVSFADFSKSRNADGSGPSTSLFGVTSVATRSATRSASIGGNPAVRNAFRISSSALQSPLPLPKKIGARAMDSTDDEDEIQLKPPPVQLSPEELEAEKLRCAENEATSKFAHHQIVVVEGRAAKVINPMLAHLSEMHLEQRHAMLRARGAQHREVLSVVSKQADDAILVEFFQKNSSEQFRLVKPEVVELLDVEMSVETTPKILGFKAAKEWAQKVKKGQI